MKRVTLKERYNKKIEQERLKEQYGIQKPNVVIVEKKSVVGQVLRTILNAFFLLLRILALVFVALLALVGLAGLIYPNIRAEYLVTYQHIAIELSSYF